MNERDLGYVIVTDYVSVNSGRDVSDEIQKIIQDHPNRTIYFPDGEYLLSKPILTPANPIHSVSLCLSAYAVLKASDDWCEQEAVVRLGAAEPFNDISTPGSNYYFQGGIIDGNGRANGISIDSGRETCIHHVSIKNTFIGIHIKPGANNGSSDADVHSVNIVGNAKKGSVGVLIEGHDNTLTNMRIASIHKGVVVRSGGNLLRNIHPLYIFEKELDDIEVFKTGVAFEDVWKDNFYDICYSDQFCVGFSMTTKCSSAYTNSYIMWYTDRCGVETAFHVEGKFNSIIRNPKVCFHSTTKNCLLSVTEEGGSGIIDCPVVKPDNLGDTQFEAYLTGKIIAKD